MLNIGWDLVLMLINLVVLYLLMRKFLVGPIMGVIEKRQNLIKQQLEHADTAEKKALALKGEWETSMKNVHEETEALRKEAGIKAKQEYNRIVDAADVEAKKIMQDTRQNILVEREKMLDGVRSEIAGLAMDMAVKVVSDSKTEQISSLMYDQFLKKEGGNHDTALQ